MAKIMKTMDGNEAAAYASYAFTEVAGIYPITPSSPMAEKVDEWSANGKKNIFGQTVKVVELQSEGGASGTVHGSLQAGALTTTYTASQGLLLMIPNMYKMAGELLPGVMHVSARALSTHALSIFGDHSDVMACRQTGFAMLASNSVQEVMDLAAVAHLSAIKSRIPFLHFFDGFRTSHEIQKIECLDYRDLEKLADFDEIAKFRKRALNPEHPVLRGSAQNPDIYFQGRESSNKFYDKVPDIVAEYMNEISKLTGRNYKPFNFYGHPEAERVVVAMGSVCEAAEEVVDFLMEKGEKVGLIKVHLYRPFSVKYLLDVLPQSATKIAVLDRTKESGSFGEPLFLDIAAALAECRPGLMVIGGRYGLGSKDTDPDQIVAVFENLKLDRPKNHFTIGIVDDVTHLSLDVKPVFDMDDDSTISCKFWGLGSDGTVGANKNSIKIIGDYTDKYAQAYFSYDSKKSGGVTQSHLRFGDNAIRSTYLVQDADFVACHKQEYIYNYDIVNDIKEGGTFLLNTVWAPEELEDKLPGDMKRVLAEKHIKFYIINGTKIAKEIGLGNRVNSVLQAAFFKLSEIIPIDDAANYMKQAIKKSYAKKGEKVLNMNYQAVDKGIEGVVEIPVPEEWAECVSEPVREENLPDYVRNIMKPMNALKGDSLPVSTFIGYEDGTVPPGTSVYEKRGIAVELPEWNPETCVECNQCSYVCPHAAIRPFLLSEEEVADAPEKFVTIDAELSDLEYYSFRIQVSPLDCVGCGTCVNICPTKTKSIVMKPAETQQDQIENWEYAVNLSYKPKSTAVVTVRASQFSQPLLEFSGACAGCGETPYAKLLTQLFGDRMYIANATGCSSIWGGSSPTNPYTTNRKGQGPAWANSLFEDNAEFGFGMYTAVKHIREGIKEKLERLIDISDSELITAKAKDWIANMDNGSTSRYFSTSLLASLKRYHNAGREAKEIISYIMENKEYLVKKSHWILGGDGWAYDIGYGGLDHVLASGEDVNIFVFDTEVYSNTGGQASKSTPTGAVAQFAASGKRTKKKDLGMMAMSYGYVYVAQVGMGAKPSQLSKALIEAEAYHGPSLIIAYAPCINHGIDGGMMNSQNQIKRAVDHGYWHLYRYNPDLKNEGKNPFVLDSQPPKKPFREFIETETRYMALKRTFPDIAEELFEKLEKDAKERYETYKRLADGYNVPAKE